MIDANVVLNLYRYPETVRDDLLKSLQNVADRLWMPFQAAFEYQRRRLDVISEQKKAFDTIKNELTTSVSKIQSLFSSRHPLIEQGVLVEGIQKLVSTYVSELQPLSDKQPAVHDDDTIRMHVDQLLQGRVGPEPSKEDVDAVCVEGLDRYERKVPPGFMDHKKDEVHHFRGVRYESKFGDLLLWKQLLSHAKNTGCKYLIFITDDNKEDWWQITSGKTIGPLPALKAEMKMVANVENFHMYTTENFLRFSEKYLKADIDPKSIDQVAEINEAKKEENSVVGRFFGVSEYNIFRVYVDDNLSADDRLNIASKIRSNVRKYFPDNEINFSFSNGMLIFSAPSSDLDFEVYSSLAEIPGVIDVRSSPINSEDGSISVRRHRRPELNDIRELFDLKITFDRSEGLSFIHIANWIKMTLGKELSWSGLDAMRTFNASPTPDGVLVNIHVPLSLRQARRLARTINDMAGVGSVVVVKSSS